MSNNGLRAFSGVTVGVVGGLIRRALVTGAERDGITGGDDCVVCVALFPDGVANR